MHDYGLLHKRKWATKVFRCFNVNDFEFIKCQSGY